MVSSLDAKLRTHTAKNDKERISMMADYWKLLDKYAKLERLTVLIGCIAAILSGVVFWILVKTNQNER